MKFQASASRGERADTRVEEGITKTDNLSLIRAEVVDAGARPAEEVARDLERRPEVEYAVPDLPVIHREGYSDEPRFGELWGLNNTGQRDASGTPGTPDVDINALEASAVTQGDPNLVVAVIDDGVDFAHPDLAGRQWVNPGESGDGKETNNQDDDGNGCVDDVNGCDIVAGDGSVHDPGEDMHGTHVAGTIAASLNGEGVVGVAPNVKIMAIKFIDSTGAAYTSDAIMAIEYAAAQGVKISNNSWGIAPGSPPMEPLEEAIEASGMLFVAAAGNYGHDNDLDPNNASYPAAYDSPNILTVASVDNQGELAIDSNYGATTIDISAPGVGILSSVPGTPKQPAVVLSSVGPSGKALVAGFGAEEIEGEDRRASFLGKAFGAVGRTNEPVVLVDDDRNRPDYPDVRPSVSEAIRMATGTDPEVIGVADGDGPALARLQGKVVVWATGWAHSSSDPDPFSGELEALTASDRQTLTDLLAGGGKLVLAGPDALRQIEASEFVRGVLGVDFQREVATANFEGYPNSGFAGESYSLTSSFANGRVQYHDAIAPSPGKTTVAQGAYPASRGDWERFSGTSMATPHATGAAALAASARPSLLDDPAGLRRFVLDGAKPLPPTEGRTLTGGMVNANLDTVPPAVKETTPAGGAKGVAVYDNVEAQLSEDVRADSVSGNTLTLTKQGSMTPVAATVSYDSVNKKAVLNPSADLAFSSTYTAVLKGGPGGVEDHFGNRLAADMVWSFTTAGVDSTPPQTTITSGPSSFYGTDNSPSFAFSSNEPRTTFLCRIDWETVPPNSSTKPPFRPCDSPKAYALLGDGRHEFEVKAVDYFGNADATPASEFFFVDTVAPEVSAPSQGFVVPSALSSVTFGYGLPLRVTWSGQDRGGFYASGPTIYELQRSVEGGAWSGDLLQQSPVPPAAGGPPTSTTLSSTLGTAYRFRVRVQDVAGNWSGWVEGPNSVGRGYDEGNAAVSYPAGSWTRQQGNAFYNGAVKYATTAGARARFTFTGRELAWVASKGPSRGKAEVWVDGVKVGTVNLYSGTAQHREVVFRKAWPTSGNHTIAIVATGTRDASSSGTRVDVDAFLGRS